MELPYIHAAGTTEKHCAAMFFSILSVRDRMAGAYWCLLVPVRAVHRNGRYGYYCISLKWMANNGLITTSGGARNIFQDRNRWKVAYHMETSPRYCTSWGRELGREPEPARGHVERGRKRLLTSYLSYRARLWDQFKWVISHSSTYAPFCIFKEGMWQLESIARGYFSCLIT